MSLSISQARTAVVNGSILDILEGDRGNEARRLPRLGNLAVKLIDLLERKTLSLVDHSPDEEDADEAASTPDEEDLGAHVGVAWAGVDHVGRRVTDTKVKEPVGSGGHGKGLGADLEREDLTSDDPGDRPPGAGEEEDVDTDEGNQETLNGEVVCADDGSGNSDNELADSHANGSEEQETAATPLLDKPETGEGGNDVDAGCDQGDDESIADTGILEEGSTVVEDKVDTGQLLKSLETATSRETLAKIALEAVEVSSLAEGELVLVVRSNFSKLLNKSGVLDVQLAELGQRLSSLLRATLLDVPARGLGDEDAADEHDDGPGKLDGDGNAVSTSVVAVLGSIVDDGSDQETDGDSKLVATNNCATDPLGGGLGLVERDGGGDHTNSVTSEETASNEDRNVSGDGLEDNTKTEDNVGGNETHDTTEQISSRGGGQGTEEGTSRKD